MENIFVITPIFNEKENISRLIKSFQDITEKFESNFNFIIVDDGSTDGTIEEIERLKKSLNVKVLDYGCNKGPGYAFATGFEYIANKITQNDIVVTMEGDNTSRIETLYLMIARLKREKIDCVLASPYAYGGGITNTGFLRTFLSHVANTFIKEMLGIRGIHTMSSFFRVYDAKLIIKLQKVYQPRILMMNGFESMIELLKKIILLEASISEMSMKLDTSLRQGKSKMKIVKTIFGYFSLYFKQKDWKSKYELYVSNT
jgi:dolichol-phosphate mannosyltransferase